MKLAITLSFALAAVMGFAFAQDMGGQDAPKKTTPMPAMPLGPHHEHMKAQEGTWDYTATFQMGPEKTEGKGTQVNTIKADGLWMVIEATGDMGKSKFWGHGVAGYDAQTKKHVSSWVDNCADYVQTGEGECADDCKTLTTWVNIKSMEDPTKWGKMKEVMKVVDKDNLTLTFSVTGPDGKEVEIGWIKYKRKK